MLKRYWFLYSADNQLFKNQEWLNSYKKTDNI